jgi:lipoprotein-anchoring transpeptidase ErfK/SrfK
MPGRDAVVLARLLAAAGVIASISLGAAEPARARVVVTIDKSTQRMTVAVDGATRHLFTVSTGRAGFGTPNGRFRPQRLARTWFSKKYYNSPMPHSIFFHGGYAIHGSYEIRRLGGPASHGCVRLHPGDAAALFALVKSKGTDNTRIVVTGANPAPARSRQLARHAREPAPVVYRDPTTGLLWRFAPGHPMRILAR